MRHNVLLFIRALIIGLTILGYLNVYGDEDSNDGYQGWYMNYCDDVNVSGVRDWLLSSDPSAKLHAAHRILKAPTCYGIGLTQLAEDIVAKYADRASIPFLIKIVKARFDHRYVSGLDINVRALAALSIGKIINQHIGDKYNQDELFPDDIVHILIDTLGSSYDLRIRTASAQALGDVRDTSAIPALQAIVSNQNENPALQFVAMQPIATLQSVAISKGSTQQDQGMQANAGPSIGDPPADISKAAQNYLLLNFAPAYIKLIPQQ
jgi:HEAT repeat protein